ncbi:50S ribosomal protein-like protein [Actinidia rufa]|uniref:50S ribosomal protein-like protein n=1 Tax=Actinidia rufa TaxID=165716 RepID=A0A7J0EGM2_9ERIC|nr:50S ribosomal protein-like protein [Actinidia rufa]
MATLQKFKLLATQCAVAGSPTRSPTTSPVIHLRRRKTLRMLLGRNRWRRKTISPLRRLSGSALLRRFSGEEEQGLGGQPQAEGLVRLVIAIAAAAARGEGHGEG